MTAWAVWMGDGLHFYTSANPGDASSAMHLALRRKPLREARVSATAAIVVPFALRFYVKEEHASLNQGTDWMKRAHAQVFRALEKHGAEALTGMGPVFVELTRECMRLIDRAMGRDVEDALARVRKDFEFLLDHVEEADILRIWRETSVAKVHDR